MRQEMIIRNHQVALVYHSESFGNNSEYQSWIIQFKEFIGVFFSRNTRTNIEILDINETNFEKLNQADAIIIALSDKLLHDLQLLKKLEDIINNQTPTNIFKVVLNEYRYIEQPAFLLAYRQYTYHTAPKDDISETEQIKSQVADVYSFKNIIMANELSEYLNKEENNITAENTVFVSHTSTDLEDERDMLIRELKVRGYKVLPDILSFDKEYILNCLNKSALSVHIFGAEKGLVINNESYCQFQNRIAADFYNQSANKDKFDFSSAFSRIIWIPAMNEIADEEYGLMLEKLKTDPIAMSGAELVQTPLETLKSIVISRLNEKKSYKTRNIISDTGHSVYFIIDQYDEDLVGHIKNLSQRVGINAVFEIRSNDYIESIKHHRRQLTVCDSIVILSQTQASNWLNCKIQDLRKAPGYGRNRPFKKTLIITTPEHEINLPGNSTSIDIIKTDIREYKETLSKLLQQMN